MGRPQAVQGLLGNAALLPLKPLSRGLDAGLPVRVMG
jgi:hypothetical protein